MGPCALQRGPVALDQLGGPLLADLAVDRGPAVIVRVGGLLHLCVIPDVAVDVIRPVDHVGFRQEMILLRLAAKRAVDDGAGLGCRG